ncbi:defensin, isoforms B and C-like [Mytilus edulis]|uniref:defensin, isoforms B and C-like n=1 Tax=Mytilus edulis TaxID=6550 RepID=UPI002205938B|nr:myticofensin C1 [Mytilus coruscus]
MFKLGFLIVGLVFLISETEGAPQRRLTCEAGSANIFGVQLGTTACLTHCLFLGHLGAYCDSHNVCHCRH